MKVTVKAEGMEELDRKLKLLTFPEIRGIVSKSLRAGAKVAQKEAKELVPVRTGKLKANLKIRAGRKKKGYVSIHVMIGDKYWTGDTWYGAFVEWGHKIGHRRLGNTRTALPGEHFLEYAADESAQKAIKAIVETTKTLLEQLAASKV